MSGTRHHRSSSRADGFGHQNFPGLGSRLGAGGSIHDGTDYREVTVRPAEFAEIGLTTVNTDADRNPRVVALALVKATCRDQYPGPPVNQDEILLELALELVIKYAVSIC